MEQIIKLLSTYDFIGHVLVGAWQSLLLMTSTIIFFDMTISEIAAQIKDFPAWLLIIGFLLLGFLVQAFSSILGTDKKENTNCSDTVLAAKDHLKIDPNKSDGISWQIMYLFGLVKDESRHILTFNSSYALMRGLQNASIISVILGSIMSFIKAISLYYDFTIVNYRNLIIRVIYTFFMLLFSYVFNHRKKKFWRYLSDKIYGVLHLAINNLI